MGAFRQNRVWAIAIAMIFAITLVFLGASESGAAEGGADPAALYSTLKCNMCHAVSSAGIMAKTKSAAMLGPDLGGTKREADWIKQYVRKKTENEGKTHKSEFKGTDEDLDAVIGWLSEQAAAPAKP